MGLVPTQVLTVTIFVSTSKAHYLLFQGFMCETLRKFLYVCSKSLCGVYVHCVRIPEDRTKSSARVRTKLLHNVLLNDSNFSDNHLSHILESIPHPNIIRTSFFLPIS